jgi:hypothetical protein
MSMSHAEKIIRHGQSPAVGSVEQLHWWAAMQSDSCDLTITVEPSEPRVDGDRTVERWKVNITDVTGRTYSYADYVTRTEAWWYINGIVSGANAVSRAQAIAQVDQGVTAAGQRRVEPGGVLHSTQ